MIRDLSGPKLLLVSLLILSIIPLFFNNCSNHPREILGKVELTKSNDSLIVDYDLFLRKKNVDSVAIQLLPEFRRNRIWYQAEQRIKDSIFNAYKDSIGCCFPVRFAPEQFGPDSVNLIKISDLLDACSACWWNYPAWVALDRFERKDNGYLPEYVWKLRCKNNLQVYLNDSLALSGIIDSLRKHSVPCTWQLNNSAYDTVVQTDLVVYRVDAFDHDQRKEFSGRKIYPIYNKYLPTAYCVKLYETKSIEDDQYRRSLAPVDIVWYDVIPQKPMTRAYRFEEEGGSLGMGIGLGGSKYMGGHLNGDNSNIQYMPALSLAFQYYSPRTLYQISFDFEGLDTTGEVPTIGKISPLGIRRYFSGMDYKGLFSHGGIEFTSLEGKVDSKHWEDIDFGVEVGIGYETDFDRLAYYYHTGQGGFHEFELLVGFQALQQGKVGLKASYKKGDGIEFSMIQAYMENRIDFKTMELSNPRSLPMQIFVFSGMIASWLLIQ